MGIAHDFPFLIKDASGNDTYCEWANGFWWRVEYDKHGNQTYLEGSNGVWAKREYDESGNLTHYEDSDGYKEGTPL